MTSLVIQTSFLGDTILTTPLIGELATRGPVDVVTSVPGAALLAHDPRIRRLIEFDKRGSKRGPLAMFRMAADLRRASQYESAYLAQGSARSAALSVLVGARERVGFETSAGRWLYTRRVPFRDDLHHAARLLSLAGDIVQRPRPSLYPGPEDVAAADALLQPFEARRFIAIAPGSAWATKRWPYYDELARRLSESYEIVVLGGPEDAELARGIASSAGLRAINAAGRLEILASAEVIRRATALVTNDSAPLHLGSAMNTPTLAVFGPTVPAFGFGPLADRSTAMGFTALRCRPCHRHGPKKCPLRHWRCMRDITAEEVYRSLEMLITPTNE